MTRKRTVQLRLVMGLIGMALLALLSLSYRGSGGAGGRGAAVRGPGILASGARAREVDVSSLSWGNDGTTQIGPEFYVLETCDTCSQRNVMASRCKDYYGDMKIRLSLASQGRLRENRQIWNFKWLCRPDAWPQLEKTLERGTEHRKLLPGQLINYFPGARTHVFPKDALCNHITAAWGERKAEFFAACFVLPKDHDGFLAFQDRLLKDLARFQREHRHPRVPDPADDPSAVRAADSAELDRSLALESDAAAGKPVWVVKEFKSFGGHGISFYRGALTPAFLVGKSLYLQRLVDPPALIHGRKFDLRLYALVPSFDPFRVYLYTRGYARRTFAQYESDLGNALAHITNHDTQLKWAQRTDPALVSRNMTMLPGDAEDSPFVTKWPLRAVLRYFAAQGFAARDVWARVRAAVARSLAAVARPLSCRDNPHGHDYPCGSAFQHFGVDLMFDDTLTPYVIEVNTQPMLRFNTAAIAKIQTAMVSDQVRMMGLIPGEPSHVHDVALQRALASAGLPPLPFPARKELGRMLREHRFRGLFDLAFPRTAADAGRSRAARTSSTPAAGAAAAPAPGASAADTPSGDAARGARGDGGTGDPRQREKTVDDVLRLRLDGGRARIGAWAEDDTTRDILYHLPNGKADDAVYDAFAYFVARPALVNTIVGPYRPDFA